MKKTNPDQPRRRLKKRFILIDAMLALFVLASLFYVDYVGDRYVVNTYRYYEDAVVTDVRMECSKDDVVVMEDYSFDEEGQLQIYLESDEAGETDATFYISVDKSDQEDVSTTHFIVNEMGTIIEKLEFFTNFSGYRFLTIAFLLFILLIIGVMIYSFFECRRRSDYSYGMVAYGGIALYLFVLFSVVVYKMLNNVVNSFSDLVYHITQTGDWLCRILLPLMLTLAIAVSISNIWLLRHEGFRPVNALGIAISIVWILALMMTLNLGWFSELVYAHPAVGVVRYVMSYIISYFECMLLSVVVCAFMASRHTPPLDRDYIIILGCAIRRDGSLTPLLKGRVDSALRFEARQYQETGRRASFVPSGGQGPDEVISEAEAMERYLLEQGVEPERVLREDKSVNTNENMKFSRQVIESRDEDFAKRKIAFATTNYHIFRGYILSGKNGFKAQGISAKTKWYFFPNAFLREFIGLLYDQILRHAVIIFLIIAFALGISYAV